LLGFLKIFVTPACLAGSSLTSETIGKHMKSVQKATAFESDPRDLSAKSEESYGELAPEYYCAHRHPTCANFDLLQDALLDTLRPLVSKDGFYVEVGCGKGRLDRLAERATVVLTDISDCMLGLARQRTRGRVRCERMNVFKPHFTDGTVDGVFGFLADPFNHGAFFQNSHRMLSEGGRLVVTLPNHEWAVAVRTALGQPIDQTTFINCQGRKVTAPSITRPRIEQIALMKAIGYDVQSTWALSLNSLAIGRPTPSHHVILAAQRLALDPLTAPLVDVFVAAKI